MAETAHGKRVLGVITARGGSKGLPRKNILQLAGKPLVAYTIEAALGASLLDRVVVSTDDDEIARVSRQYGADVPFLRPQDLAQDETPIYPGLIHAVQWLEERQNWQADYILLLQPTSPLRKSTDIDGAIRLALERDADGVVSLSEVKQHPYQMKRLTEDGCIRQFIAQSKAIDRRQELPPVYAVNGAIYLVKRSVLLEQETFYTERTYAYLMPPERSLDIDSKWDFHLAELVLRGNSDGGAHSDSRP